MDLVYIYEFLGTFILILLGDGVVANTILKGTKSEGAGWLTITLGWGLAVFMAVIVAGPYSGAHINPAVSVGLAIAGLFSWSLVPGYILAQVAGAFFGGVIVYLFFKPHFNQTEDLNAHIGVFCTAPAIRHTRSNFFSEMVGTFVLIILVLYIAGPTFEASTIDDAKIGLGSIGALPVALVVTGIGISLGGTTGYAINPARDLGPRIAYAVLPFAQKRDADWGYSWIPVFGPIAGAAIAALIYLSMNL
ncbi:MAG TPA: MIP/aquaporin family protein [Bacteroidales bacterium]|nr:MIP/aquaporin family protein [Bacteroidales bacterium]